MIPSLEDPARQQLKLEDWPEGDRAAWNAALAPGDLLDGTVGPAFHLSPATQTIYRNNYGRWLTSRIRAGGFDPMAKPASRITPEAVGSYLLELQSQVSSRTVCGYIRGLKVVAQAFDPDADWNWLRRIVGKLEATAKDSKDKHSRLREANEILAWAVARMTDIEGEAPRKDILTDYRNALMIGLLISCPTMRLRNLSMIEIGRHLVRRSDGWELRFSGPEMKGRRPAEMRIPTILVPFLNHYLQFVRPLLLGGAVSDLLWITRYGLPMTCRAVHSGISNTTKRAFGKPINPHLFRDCAVTFVAQNDPKHIGIAAPILGHSDPRTTERYYIQAQQIAAGTKLQASLKLLRKRHASPHNTRSDKKDVGQ